MSDLEQLEQNRIFPARLKLAEAAGWQLLKTEGMKKGQVWAFMQPPKHFECQKNQWAAIHRLVPFEGIQVNVPHWFWDDNVLTTGHW